MLTFQDLIFKLITYWSKQGCLFQQGHDLEVGAGTFNPATFLRSLGPEPYNTVYVEPSRRPQDGRYGINPNRTQYFHQLQVIMKPSPEDIQTLYLNSLKEIGFDLSKHDVRFVHDDWESPTLGAAGLGWEVWIDGMEVTQFTYFQQVAGESLSPIPVELTYGLERLCMFIQGVDNFYDMQWNETLTYGDLFKRNEEEWSRYNFEASNPDMWRRHFDEFEKEAQDLLAIALPLPAYDFVMKASHAFNMLEARGLISVTERTGYIHRIRDLAKETARIYLQAREKIEFPLLKALPKPKSVDAPEVPPVSFDPEQTEDFILEIGSEELPAAYIPSALVSLKGLLTKALKKAQLPFDSIEVTGTPRRLTAIVHKLSQGRGEKISKRRGPPVERAFDSDGNITPQGRGFLKSVGLEATKLDDIETKDGYLYVETTEKGASTLSLLARELPEIIESIAFPKKMRWGQGSLTFARPIHWILALFGKEIVPFKLGTTISSNVTYGHAQRAPGPITLTSPSDYFAKLEEKQVIASTLQRREMIETQLSEIETELGARAVNKERVLSEVLFLTEFPELVSHTFDKNFLRIPHEVLTSEMIEHQRYFPLETENGELINHFVITADNTPNATIVKNNLSVLSARLTDGVFLYEQDLKSTLDAFTQKLKNITFQKGLGSVYDKSKRLAKLGTLLQQALNIGELKAIERAALLAKADLATELVAEFPELQGVIGKHYALKQGETADVAEAIEEHYLPNSEFGPLPQSLTGQIVSLADKFDNLIANFSIGKKPTSSSDPYALRRQAIGLLKILIEMKRSVNLESLLFEMCAIFPKLKGHPAKERELVGELLTFLTGRAKSVLLDYEFSHDEIEASLQGVVIDPYDQFLKTQALCDFRKGDDFTKLLEVYKRAKGQLANQPSFTFDATLAREAAEKSLASALETMTDPWAACQKERDYSKAFGLLATLKEPLSDLFDTVKILADDPKVKANRIALLQRVFKHFDTLLDFSKIQ